MTVETLAELSDAIDSEIADLEAALRWEESLQRRFEEQRANEVDIESIRARNREMIMNGRAWNDWRETAAERRAVERAREECEQPRRPQHMTRDIEPQRPLSERILRR